MTKFKFISFCIKFLLALLTITACTAPDSPVAQPTASVEPTATLKPTPTAIIIEPILLPTTIPQQAVRLEEATKRKRSSVTVDFVIDVSELKNGVTPVQLYYGDNWYKYTSPDNAFSVLMRGSFGPTESTYTTTIGNSYLEIKAVEAAYLLSERQIVSTFEIPSTVIDDVTLEQFLDSLDPTTRLSTDANAIIDADNRIQLDGIPGREWIFRVTTDDNPKPTQPIHVRIYVIGRTIYHLTFGGMLTDANETGERFLNSFTLHRSAP